MFEIKKSNLTLEHFLTLLSGKQQLHISVDNQIIRTTVREVMLDSKYLKRYFICIGSIETFNDITYMKVVK